MPESTPTQQSQRRGASEQYVESVQRTERGYCLEYTIIGNPPYRVCKRPSNPPITITKRGPDPHDRA